jgi:hypothetical protein
MKYFKIVNLDKYQTYRGRNPSWIKLYVKMLDDERIRKLFDSEKWLFVSLILLAVGCNNCITNDPQWIYSRVSYRTLRGGGRGLLRVRLGTQKMLKLGLISLCDNNIERKIRKKERESLNNINDETAFKRKEVRENLQKMGIIKKIK